MEMANLMGIDNFKASNGWMEKFKERHSIRFIFYFSFRWTEILD